MQAGLSTGFANLVKSLLFIIVVLILLFKISPSMTFLVLTGVIVIMIFGGIFAVCMFSLGKATQSAKAKMNTVAEETFANVRTVKAFH